MVEYIRYYSRICTIYVVLTPIVLFPYHGSMSGQLPPKTSLNHPTTNGQLNGEEVAREEDYASGETPYQVSLLHLDSPGASARMRRAMRLILKRFKQELSKEMPKRFFF